ncbi:hypothetical protein HYV80_00815 [Candidatus Woesearchaeota archaeon]|nr:hypothetical protein [Candidatus Woesearchaeota archaeon]
MIQSIRPELLEAAVKAATNQLQLIIDDNPLPDEMYTSVSDMLTRIRSGGEDTFDIWEMFHGRRAIGILPENLRNPLVRHSHLKIDYETGKYYLS